jgi:Zinc carboxypeptidase
MRRLLLAAALLVAAVPLHAQQLPYPARQKDAVGRDDRTFSFYERGPYKPGVPRPDALLGYELGDLNTQFADQQRVLMAIADAARDRVRVEEIGSSVERRPMRLFIVSSPENIARLDAIRADLDALADPRGKTPAQLDGLAARTPAVVMINESVHGNESPGFETAMQTLYQLAASDEPATVNALKNVVVVLNPSSNPDGHERFAVWYNSIHVGAPDNWSAEKDEPWSIVGRSNHYRFNMNRDVAASTQREVQALVRAMLRWHPMVAVDQHGQTTNYFFPPAARPVNVNIGAQSEKWLDRIGRGNAAAFDRYGWMYFVRDAFDLGGPFYYDSWPSLTGATGMTYETDGGGHLGILWKREDGSLLSFRDGIAKHWVAAMATIETTAAGAQERVRDYVGFRRNAVEAGRTERMKRVVLVPGSDPARAAELVSTLLRSGIEVRRASAGFASARAHAYYDERVGNRRFDAGAYVIDLAQPQGRLAKALLEPADELDPVFGKAMIDKYRRNTQRGKREQGEFYEFYDVTAWSFPVSFGVESYWTEDATPVGGDLLTLPAEEPALPAARDVPRRVGGELLAVEVGGGIVAGRGARSAYLFTSERSGAPRLAWQLMDEGFRVAVATLPIEAGERDWPRGTYVVRVARNDTTLHARIDALAREAGVEVTGVNTAYTTRAQYGVGSGPVTPLVPAKVAVLGDEGLDVNDYGAVWWTLERRYGVRFAPVNWDGLRRALEDVNVLVMPSGSPGRINQRLGKAGADAIRAWVERGGTLVTMGGASAWAAREDVNLTSARAVGGDTTGTRKDTTVTNDPALAELTGLTSPTASNATPQSLPGTNFDVVLDRTHWLTLGYAQPRLTAMLSGDTFLKPSREGTNVAVFPGTGLLARGGFTWPDNTERLLRGTSLVIDEPTGSGHVILFNNEPMFRGWWRALDKLVLNAIVLGPAM